MLIRRSPLWTESLLLPDIAWRPVRRAGMHTAISHPANAFGNAACGQAGQKTGNWINECDLERPARPLASNVDARVRYVRLCRVLPQQRRRPGTEAACLLPLPWWAASGSPHPIITVVRGLAARRAPHRQAIGRRPDVDRLSAAVRHATNSSSWLGRDKPDQRGLGRRTQPQRQALANAARNEHPRRSALKPARGMASR
jgi:hypothetical protein